MKLLILKGFTLIELLVAAGIIALISAITIPSYIKFSRSQEVAQAALNLKNILRNTQNRALSSEKTLPCTASDMLLGFFTTLTTGTNSNIFAAGGICGNIVFNGSSPSFSGSSNMQIQSFVNASISPCSLITLVSGKLTVFFRPLALGTQFYDGNTSALPLSNPLSYQKIGILLTNGGGNNYYVLISSSGDIDEKSTCP